MRRSRSTPTTTRSHRDPARPHRPPVDVYLMPAIVGGGRGDVEEVLLVGRALARRGHRVLIARSRPLPLLQDRSLDWTGIVRVPRPTPRAAKAVTISSQFGVTASDARPGPLGAAGPWAVERAAIDRAYGPDRVLHVSLEEFQRGRPARYLAEERYREGGRTARSRQSMRSSRAFRQEVAEFVRLYRKFRAFDVSDLLTIFPSFLPSRTFGREFPESVQSGPLWPEPLGHRRQRSPRGPVRVLWYASPSTSDRLAPRLLRALGAQPRPVELTVRSPRPLPLTPPRNVAILAPTARSPSAWQRTWAGTDFAIVTGTRSLLEAIRWGVPFLYFNGILGRGAAARRHRPEKIEGLVEFLRRSGVAPALRRDLAQFSRLQGLEAIVARSLAGRPPLPGSFPRQVARGFPPPFGDGITTVADLVQRFAAGRGGARALVREVRAESRRRPARAGSVSKV